jgi:hypothetical protein
MYEKGPLNPPQGPLEGQVQKPETACTTRPIPRPNAKNRKSLGGLDAEICRGQISTRMLGMLTLLFMT